MSMIELSVHDAHARQQQGATLVDVRSTREYGAGHAAGAVNVPLLEHDEDSDQLLANPDFVRVMQANFPPDAPLLLSCQAGGRSSRAAKMLETFGFSSIVNVLGGFCGTRDAGLPVSTSPTEGGSYEEMLAKADQNH